MKDIDGKQIKEQGDLSQEEGSYYQLEKLWRKPDVDDMTKAVELNQLSPEAGAAAIDWIESDFSILFQKDVYYFDVCNWMMEQGYRIMHPDNRFGFDFFKGDPSPWEWQRYHLEPRIEDYLYFEDDLKKGIIETLTTLVIDPENYDDDGFVNYLESILYSVYNHQFYQLELEARSNFNQIIEIVEEPVVLVDEIPEGYPKTYKMARLKMPYDEVDKVLLAQILDNFFSDENMKKRALEAVSKDINGSYM